MKHNEINVTVNNEEMNTMKIEKALKALETLKEKNKKYSKKSYISDTDWTEYDSMKSDEIAFNDLLTRTVINKGFSCVRKVMTNKANNADYKYVNNLPYVSENFPHIVSEVYIRMETTYRFKYADSVWHAVRACVINAIDKCRRDDFSNASALFEVNSDGDEYCIIDTSNETKRDYEINTEMVAIAYAELSKASELIKYIVWCKLYTDFSNESIAEKAFNHGYTEKQYTGQYIGKIYKKWQESIN